LEIKIAGLFYLILESGVTDLTSNPPPPGDTVREDWLRAVEEEFGPGWARITRRMEEWRVDEVIALRYYQAVEDGWPPPEIADGVKRHYAYSLGQAVADLNQAVDAKDSFWERAHRSAVGRVHSAVYRYHVDRDELGLPLESSPKEIDTARYRRLCARGGWAKPAWAREP
jgi:hypothetical protein